MKDEKISLLIREGEGLAVEFKERYSPRIGQDIVAFANARSFTGPRIYRSNRLP